MKVTMQLTIDGLIRALRLKSHGLAEDAEGRYARKERRVKLPPPARRKSDRTMETDDAGTGR